MKSSKDLGQIIKNLRINKSLTQEQLANLLKITPQAISKWENGESYPDLPILDKLAEIFEITLDYLIKDITESKKKNEYRGYLMSILKDIFNKLSSQIRFNNDKLSTKAEKAHTIQDNDQSIKLGAINEESNSNLRSASTTGQKRRRSNQSNRTNRS
jgi:transcriptional regulator with XRE-family HTH domain